MRKMGKGMFLQKSSAPSTIDSRGRFQMPAAILQAIPAEYEGHFVINRSPEKCLTLYPIRIWKAINDKMNKQNTLNTDTRRAVRYFTGAAVEVKLDAKNRLLIPPQLQDYAHLEKDLLISTMNRFIEIWNPKLYNKELDDPEIPKSAAYNNLTDDIDIFCDEDDLS
jgi:MraZ protein